ncbi:MAG: hypothetical protein OXL97_01570 [Chloroflexota bacterium]|nr:hypothetical protein [Chloroflexota bacterium]MDE2885793.1 hypothetical protein [Chloroflexota bacterium]
MQKYLVLYHASADAMQAMMDSTPEQMKAVIGAWKAWADRCGDALVEMSPLSPGGRMTASGSSANEMGVVTYSVLQAESMESAQALLADHPHMGNPGCEIEVYETMSLPWQ